MRFYKVNTQYGFYKFMITEPHHVFSGFLPVGFSEEERAHSYQNTVTQKTYNELYNKKCELNRLKERLSKLKNKDDLEALFLQADYYTLIRILLKDADLIQEINKKSLGLDLL